MTSQLHYYSADEIVVTYMQQQIKMRRENLLNNSWKMCCMCAYILLTN
jgi:hypothetical protein